MIDWSKISSADHGLVNLIADRAKRSGDSRDKLSIVMDLTAAHIGVGLRLDELLAAPDFDFNHDVYGIARHMDRDTGKLRDCFLPRFTRREPGIA